MRRLLLLAVVLTGCGGQTAVTVNVTTVRSACQARGPLPDQSCTPGVANPGVTQKNIRSTVCKSGWTKTIRPPVSYTSPLKIRQIALYGYSDTVVGHYEEDHLISLELGGSPTDPRNLWPEPHSSSFAKDSIENKLRRRVCDGTITLAAAQHEIAGDWTAVR